MKKTLCVLCLFMCVLALGVMGARAQEIPVYDTASIRPQTTAPDYVAMLFHKLTGQPPDFESWAKATEEYRKASDFDRLAVLDAQMQMLQSTYSLLTIQEPLVFQMPVRLSPYSTTNKGFFVEDFKFDTYFPVDHVDRHFAVIPQGIQDSQWLAVEDAAKAGRIVLEVGKNPQDPRLLMVLMLTSKFADKSAPLRMEDKDYWLISASVKKMMLFTADGSEVLWRSDESRPSDNKLQQDLLDLYRQ